MSRWHHLSLRRIPRPPLSLTQNRIWAAYEPFERGYLIWRSDTREIHVLYDDGIYETYEDSRQEVNPVDIPTPSFPVVPYIVVAQPASSIGFVRYEAAAQPGP